MKNNNCNILKSSWYQLLDSVIKSRVCRLKNQCDLDLILVTSPKSQIDQISE